MDREQLRRDSLAHVWNPYTQMQVFADEDFPIIERGEGRKLFDVNGDWWWDGTSSMWLTLFGHQTPELDQALIEQVGKIAHSTFLGQSGEPGIRYAKNLTKQTPGLPHVFYSDDGSTAVESAIKLALQYWAQIGHPERNAIASFDGAYHGDTLGAISAAPVPEFHAAFDRYLGEGPIRLPWPDTTRGPHPGDHDATKNWALGEADKIIAAAQERLAAVIVEPIVQCVGGLRIMPEGYLAGLRKICDDYGVLLILDEVATGFGRTGTLFAYQSEDATPDLLALGKGITGGYLPLAATLSSSKIYDAFLGTYGEMKAFYHGHSYTGNALGCAVADASLHKLLQMQPEFDAKIAVLADAARRWKDLPFVGEVRHRGFMLGVDLVKDKESMEPFAWQSRAGWAVYEHAKANNLLARPYASTGLLIPPLGSTLDELREMVRIYEEALVAAQPKLQEHASEVWPEINEVPV